MAVNRIFIPTVGTVYHKSAITIEVLSLTERIMFNKLDEYKKLKQEKEIRETVCIFENNG